MNVLFSLLSLFMISQKADLILYNGKIMTMNNNLPYVEALAIRGNKIIAIGSDEEILRLKKRNTKTINLKRKLALPGFNDTHLHFLSGGESLFILNLNEKDEEGIKEDLRKKVKQVKKGEWIEGRGWDQYYFKNGKFPTKEFLDKIAPENPVILKRVGGHIILVNSKALELAKINRDPISPKGGEIVHYQNGEPTGILKENAANLIYSIMPVTDFNTVKKYILKALEEAKKYGITSIQDNSSLLALKVYKYLYRRGKLNLRISFWGDFNKTPAENMKIKNSFRGYNPRKLKFGIIKGFMDGTLGARTAKMFFPYADKPETTGLFTIDIDDLFRKVTEFDKAGFQIGFHAIGDYGVWTALEAFKIAKIKNGTRDSRHRIEHSQTVREEDLNIYKNLGIIASVQPSHMIYDFIWAEKRLGKKRVKEAYRWKSFVDKGVKIAFGTDWPIVPLNPMIGIYAAVTRKNLKGFPVGGWNSKEKISIYKALRYYTLGGAYASFEENYKGTLEPGKLADIIVLSKDITELPPSEILKTKVEMTIFDGKIIYKNKK